MRVCVYLLHNKTDLKQICLVSILLCLKTNQSLSFRHLGKLQINNPQSLKCRITQNLRILGTQKFKKPFCETNGCGPRARGVWQLRQQHSLRQWQAPGSASRRGGLPSPTGGQDKAAELRSDTRERPRGWIWATTIKWWSSCSFLRRLQAEVRSQSYPRKTSLTVWLLE